MSRSCSEARTFGGDIDTRHPEWISQVPLRPVRGLLNQKLGTLRELRVANATAKIENLRDFVIPLRIDDLPHDEINIEIGRLNAIEFREWAPGLRQLCEKLETDAVPRSPSSGTATVRRWWEREFAADDGVIGEPEIHYSNWFPLRLPSCIHRHSAIGLLESEPRWAFPNAMARVALRILTRITLPRAERAIPQKTAVA